MAQLPLQPQLQAQIQLQAQVPQPQPQVPGPVIDQGEEDLPGCLTPFGGRIRGSLLFITWPALAFDELSHARILAFLLTKGRPLDEWVICRERHKNPASEDRAWHWHAYMKSSTVPWDSVDQNFFRMTGNTGRHLGFHAKKVGSSKLDRARTIYYLLKDLDVRFKLNKLDLSRIGMSAWVSALLDAPNAAAGMRSLRKLAPKLFFLQGKRVMENLRFDHRHQLTPKFALNEFSAPPLTLGLAVVLHGPTGTGKTSKLFELGAHL